MMAGHIWGEKKTAQARPGPEAGKSVLVSPLYYVQLKVWSLTATPLNTLMDLIIEDLPQ